MGKRRIGQHLVIPKIFINFIATSPEKKECVYCGETFITSGEFVAFLTQAGSLTHHFHLYDIVTLPKETETIIYKYYCDCVPFSKNQLGVVRAYDELAELWGPLQSP